MNDGKEELNNAGSTELESGNAMKGVAAAVLNLSMKISEMEKNLFFLESEILAIGNYLVEKGLADGTELAKTTGDVVERKLAELAEKNGRIKAAKGNVDMEGTK